MGMPRSRKIPDWMVDRIRQLRKEGLTYEKIARKLGISHTTVWKYLHPSRAKSYYDSLRRRNRGIEVPEGAGLQCPYCKYKWRPYKDYIPWLCPQCKHTFSKLPKIVWGVKPRKHHRGRLEKKWREIVRAYRGGESLVRLASKYKASVSSIRDLLKRHGVKLRSFSESLLYYNKGWRRLSRMNRNYCTRIISIPTGYLRKLGYRGTERLLGKWEVRRGGLYLRIKKA
jgi:transcriptional regulator with XRE-family HTH domain